MRIVRSSIRAAALVASTLALAACDWGDPDPLVVRPAALGAPSYEVGEDIRIVLAAEGGPEEASIDWASVNLPNWLSARPDPDDERRLIVTGAAPMGASSDEPYEISFQAKTEDRAFVTKPRRYAFHVAPFRRTFTNAEGVGEEVGGSMRYDFDLGRQFRFHGDERSVVRIEVDTIGLHYDPSRCEEEIVYCLDFLEVTDPSFGVIHRKAMRFNQPESMEDAATGEILDLETNLIRNAVADGKFAVRIITQEEGWSVSSLTVVID
ncbi:MAG: hypothetical protein ACF8PN_07020 [Phycisphaerales bacterium]